MKKQLEWATRISLGLLLTTTAVLKLASPHDHQFWLPPTAYYGTAVAELAVVALALCGFRWAPACFSVAIGAIGSALVVWAKAPCGCLGAFTDRQLHLMVALSLGFLGATEIRSLAAR